MNNQKKLELIISTAVYCGVDTAPMLWQWVHRLMDVVEPCVGARAAACWAEATAAVGRHEIAQAMEATDSAWPYGGTIRLNVRSALRIVADLPSEPWRLAASAVQIATDLDAILSYRASGPPTEDTFASLCAEAQRAYGPTILATLTRELAP